MNGDQQDELFEAERRVFVLPAFICSAEGTLRSRARRRGCFFAYFLSHKQRK